MRFSLLVVEDDEKAREVLSTFIARKLPQVEVSVASDGLAGLQAFRQRPVDVVVTDIRMPGMDGVEMVRAIKEMKRETKIIMVTGYSAYKREEISQMQVHDYFVKPADFKEVIEAIEVCLSEMDEEPRG